MLLLLLLLLEETKLNLFFDASIVFTPVSRNFCVLARNLVNRDIFVVGALDLGLEGRGGRLAPPAAAPLLSLVVEVVVEAALIAAAAAFRILRCGRPEYEPERVDIDLVVAVRSDLECSDDDGPWGEETPFLEVMVLLLF